MVTWESVESSPIIYNASGESSYYYILTPETTVNRPYKEIDISFNIFKHKYVNILVDSRNIASNAIGLIFDQLEENIKIEVDQDILEIRDLKINILKQLKELFSNNKMIRTVINNFNIKRISIDDSIIEVTMSVNGYYRNILGEIIIAFGRFNFEYNLK
jgi:hypothetical protein